ncbi:NACHT, LRR and PYD domains-containing protein 3-like [Mantella aurantiaca]
MAETPLKDWKSRYLASVKESFQRFDEGAAHLEEIEGLERRCFKLRPFQIVRDEDSTIPYSGTLVEQAAVTHFSDRYSPTRIQDLFVPDDAGFAPMTVVLVGPHGIGKTLTSQRVMLDWASGNLYNEHFDFLFYLSAREINKIDGNVNIASLVAKSSALRCPENLVKSAFNDPSRVLLVLDGFDELRWTLEEDYEDYDDPFQETHKETFLRCLLKKEILEEMSLMVTSRSMTLQKMKDVVQHPSSFELPGFSPRDLQQYFHNFFQSKDQAAQASSALAENEVLSELCSVPLTCWLVCTALKAGMKEELSLANCKTLTAVYLLYLKSLLTGQGPNQPALQCLKKLCWLANEGVLNQNVTFDEEDLGRYGLTISEVASVFPNGGIFQRDLKASSDFGFLHLSLQEFLAALYYVLGEDAEDRETNGIRGDTFLPKVCKGRSLAYQTQHHPYVGSTVRFLFGLLSDRRLKGVAGGLGSAASLRAKPAMEKWLAAGRPCLDSLSCVYEAQDEELRAGALNPQDLVLESPFYSSAMESVRFREVRYCLPEMESFRSMRVDDHLMRPKDLALLAPFFHRASKLSFSRCGFAEDLETGGKASWLSNPESKIQELEFNVCVVTPSFFEDLRSLLSSSHSLTKLSLSHHKLEDSALRLLYEGLRQPGCTMQELVFDDCNLTVRSCQILCAILKANRSLRKLDMALNKIEDDGVKLLCEGLRDPKCSLRELRIEFCELTPTCCEYIRAALMTNRNLNILYLRDCNLQDAGVRLLCQALKRSGCTVKELGLYENLLSSSVCEDLLAVLLTNRTLTSLNLTYNELQDSGVKLLCEGLLAPGCTLKELILIHCGMTRASCEDLRSVFIINRSLNKLGLTWNNFEDSGVEVLCEGLRDPRCTLKELSLYGCELTAPSLEEFTSVINTTRSLTKLDVDGNEYGNACLKPLWEALSDPGCTLQEFRVGDCEMTATCPEEFLAVINRNQTLNELVVSFAYEDEAPPADLDVILRRFEHPSCTLVKNETQDGLFIHFKYKKQK